MKDRNTVDEEVVRKMAAHIIKLVDDCTNDYDAADEVKLYLTSVLRNTIPIFSKNNKN